MMFRFPPIAGVPPLDGDRTLYGAEVTKAGNPAAMPEDEWWACMKSLAGEVCRADYHYQRFLEILRIAKERRRVAGGPVFGDPESARAIYCEAAAYLTAVRTLVDLIVFVAARRAGLTVADAEDWEPHIAFSNGSAAKYHAAEIPVLQRYENWFNKVNKYRNCMNHRGWGERSFGYFEKTDTVVESNNPLNNVMLLPDLGSLAGKARPHQWTYAEREWLDELIGEVNNGLSSLMQGLYGVWDVPDAPPGTIPEDEKPNTFLTVPLGRPLGDDNPPALYVFTTKAAAKAFFAAYEKAGFGIDATYRAVRPTKVRGMGDVYLVGWEANLGDLEVRLVDRVNGRPTVVHRDTVSVADMEGLAGSVLHLTIPRALNRSVYILDCPANNAPDDANTVTPTRK